MLSEAMMLPWPQETFMGVGRPPLWGQPESNLCLDFHGDPTGAKLSVFSDGNHHMALTETLQQFYARYPEVESIFYTTTPPGPILDLLKQGGIQVGQLVVSVKPHVFISPPHVLDRLVAQGCMSDHFAFMRNQGSVLLVKKGNPKAIAGVGTLAEKGVRLFLSNPRAEAVSYRGYVETLKRIAARDQINLAFLDDHSASQKVVHGRCIHHREGPQAIADGHADAAVIYYHLALHCTRIFPSLFEIVPLGGTVQDPRPAEENVISTTHAGVVGHGGAWGKRLLEFLASDTVAAIYSGHGLVPLTTGFG